MPAGKFINEGRLPPQSARGPLGGLDCPNDGTDFVQSSVIYEGQDVPEGHRVLRSLGIVPPTCVQPTRFAVSSLDQLAVPGYHSPQKDGLL